MTTKKFAPKDADTLKSEILTDLDVEYEGNEEMIDKLVKRELKSEEFKTSLHEDKQKHLKTKNFYKENLIKAGYDPKTGEKIDKPNGLGETTPKKYSLDEIDEITALSNVHKEDRAEIVDYAERKGIKPSEALTTPFIKSFLKEQEEQRKTAEATAIKSGKRGKEMETDEKLIKKISTGELSDKEFEKAAQAHIVLKKK